MNHYCGRVTKPSRTLSVCRVRYHQQAPARDHAGRCRRRSKPAGTEWERVSTEFAGEDIEYVRGSSA